MDGIDLLLYNIPIRVARTLQHCARSDSSPTDLQSGQSTDTETQNENIIFLHRRAFML